MEYDAYGNPIKPKSSGVLLPLLLLLLASGGGNYWLWKERAKSSAEANAATAKLAAADAMQKEMTERLATLGGAAGTGRGEGAGAESRATRMTPGALFDGERHRSARGGWLRAAVLGSDDAIVSTASPGTSLSVATTLGITPNAFW